MVIEKASRDTPASTWQIRCENHGGGFKPLMVYIAQPDWFVCQHSWINLPCDRVTAKEIDRQL